MRGRCIKISQRNTHFQPIIQEARQISKKIASPCISHFFLFDLHHKPVFRDLLQYRRRIARGHYNDNGLNIFGAINVKSVNLGVKIQGPPACPLQQYRYCKFLFIVRAGTQTRGGERCNRPTLGEEFCVETLKKEAKLGKNGQSAHPPPEGESKNTVE